MFLPGGSMKLQKPIHENMKVHYIIKHFPQTKAVFESYGCPDMSKGIFKLMSRIMSLKNAARIHRIPLQSLLDELNHASQDRRLH